MGRHESIDLDLAELGWSRLGSAETNEIEPDSAGPGWLQLGMLGLFGHDWARSGLAEFAEVWLEEACLGKVGFCSAEVSSALLSSAGLDSAGPR